MTFVGIVGKVLLWLVIKWQLQKCIWQV